MDWIFGQFLEYIRQYGYTSKPPDIITVVGYPQVIMLNEEGNEAFNDINASFLGPKSKEIQSLYRNVFWYLYRISMIQHIQKLPPPPPFNPQAPALINKN